MKPRQIYQKLNKEFHFNDEIHFSSIHDELRREWGSCMYVDPPLEDEERVWIEKVFLEYKKGKTIVIILKAELDMEKIHELIKKNAAEIRYVRGGKICNKEKKMSWSQSFSNMIVIFDLKRKFL